MSIDIPLSQLRANGFADKSEFEAAVAEHIEARVSHSQSIGEARPVAHPLVESAVQRYLPPPDLMPGEEAIERFVSEFTVVDDTPPPPPLPTLAQRKQKLAEEIAMTSIQAGETVWPALTRRLISVKAFAAGAIPSDSRTAEQIADIGRYNDLQAKLAAIDLYLAETEMQIHGLTEETIDGWQPGAFPV